MIHADRHRTGGYSPDIGCGWLREVIVPAAGQTYAVCVLPERPTGTVTFLFTDIEGSTRLLQQLRDRYADVLATHAKIIREAIDEFGGHEIDTQGDSFFAAFARARDAVNAAVAIQRGLASETWPEGASVRVRMGIHTGEPLVGGERYVGMGVNRGARICAVGHGGQVLLSNTTRELVEDELPDDVRVRDLGEHELKDVKRPERIFQLEIEELPSSFPPLRTAQPSAFEGREGELARAAEVATRPRITRPRAGVGAAFVIALVAVVVGLLTLRETAGDTTVMPNSIVALDDSGSTAATVSVGARPVAVSAAGPALWVANLDDKSITRVDASTRQVVRTIPVEGGAPTGLAATAGAVWVSTGAGVVNRIDPRFDRVVDIRRQLSGSFFSSPTAARPTLAAYGAIWVVHPDGYVTRLDPRSGRTLETVGVGNSPSAIAAGAESVWVTNRADGTVTRIDPETRVTQTIPTGHGPSAVTADDVAAWVANAGDNAVVRVDPATNAVVATTPVGESPTAVVSTKDAVWVANGGDGTVMRLNPDSGDVTKTVDLGGSPTALAAAGDHVWVAVAPAPAQPPDIGGVARLTVQEDFSSLDPALAGGFSQVPYATCAGLVTYPDAPAPEGSRIVPEVAEAVPVPTDGGRTYAFRIRPSFRFSPPSNERVTAQTFKSTIERVANPRMKAYADQFSDVVGYEEYRSGKARELAGVVARGRTLTIRLSRPDGALLANLASGGACAVPTGTPVDPAGVNNLPSAGPYYVASYTPRQQLVLRRNPNYGGDRPSRLDEIVFSIGVDAVRALEQVEAGTADYIAGGLRLPPGAVQRLRAQYGPGSEAAKAGAQQFFDSTANGMRWLIMNTSRPPFANVQLRRAVNFAIDRTALVAQGHRFPAGNPFNTGQATDDYLPPTIAGATDFKLYPLDGPDLRRARGLAGRVRATAVLYAANRPPWTQEAQVIKQNLAALGIDVQVEEFPVGEFFSRLSRRGEPFDLAVSGLALGSTDPADLLGLFDGTTIAPDFNGNFSYLDDPGFNGRLQAARTLSGAQRYRAFARLALELQRDLAPVAAIATNASHDFFSARIGCQVYHPVFGIDLAALCLRE